MKSIWSENSIREQFLEFQAIHPNITQLQKEIHSHLHRIDNDITRIYNDDDMCDTKSNEYYEYLINLFGELFSKYKELYD